MIFIKYQSWFMAVNDGQSPWDKRDFLQNNAEYTMEESYGYARRFKETINKNETCI